MTDFETEILTVDMEGEGSAGGADDGSNKRKGSPLSKTDAKKLLSEGGAVGVLSERRSSLWRQNSVPDFNKMMSKDKEGGGIAFSDMVKMTFSEPSFVKTITLLLYDMMSPLISKTIEASVAATVDAAVKSVQSNVVKEMVDSNKKLQKSVAEQTRVIQNQEKIIKCQEDLLNEKNDMIEQLECQVSAMSLELDSVTAELNDLEQYGRRNSIRLNNLKLLVPPKDEADLTKTVTHFLNEMVLKDARPLRIDRCHFVGWATGKRSRQIIMKFHSFHDKNRVFAAKSNLKGNPSKTFITEDLTSRNHAVVKELLSLKTKDEIDSFWTSNGWVLVKKDADSDPLWMAPYDSLSVKLGLDSSEDADGSEPMDAAGSSD